jgi:hypothetical protein
MKSENTLHYNNHTFKAAKGSATSCKGCAFYPKNSLRTVDCDKANALISCLGAMRSDMRDIIWKLAKQKDTENA